MSDQNRDESTRDPDAKHDRRGGRDVTTRDRIEHAPNPDRRGRWLSATVALLGLWLVVQAVWLDLVPAHFWNDVLVGAALVAVGAYNGYRRSNEELGSSGVAALAAILGAWLVATPFVLGPDAGPAAGASELGVWNDVLVGLLAFGFGTYGAFVVRERRKRADARETATYDRTGQ